MMMLLTPWNLKNRYVGYVKLILQTIYYHNEFSVFLFTCSTCFNSVALCNTCSIVLLSEVVDFPCFDFMSFICNSSS